jgi:peroxiredoxin
MLVNRLIPLALGLWLVSLSSDLLAQDSQTRPATKNAPAADGTDAAGPTEQATAATQAPAANNSGAEASNPFPELTIPPNANSQQLTQLLTTAKTARPSNPQQYQAMQTAIRDASKQLMKSLEGKKDSPEYQQAELDTITSSVALMTYFGEDAKKKTLEQVHAFLNSRKELSLQDVQTGMLTAAMLELQPEKAPARDTYKLMYDLLEKDEREEMQSLRINLQASIRRLELLGNKFELEAMTIEGKPIKTDDLAGKFVVVDFFATWCEPCLAEIPRVQKQYAKYQAKGLEVIGISIDEDADSLEKFLKRAELPWPIIHDNHQDPLQRLQMKYGISQLPTVLLLNKEGTVVSLAARGAELERLMQMLFEAPTPAAPPPPPPGEPPVETKAESRIEKEAAQKQD